jgi:hypothetical protein
MDYLLESKLRPSELVIMQPDPMQWVQHAGASLRHARQMTMWPANPFTHFGADLADVLSMKLSVDEMIMMGITHGQLLLHGMTDKTERLFRFDEEVNPHCYVSPLLITPLTQSSSRSGA